MFGRPCATGCGFDGGSPGGAVPLTDRLVTWRVHDGNVARGFLLCLVDAVFQFFRQRTNFGVLLEFAGGIISIPFLFQNRHDTAATHDHE
jgi:hypothetical protein